MSSYAYWNNLYKSAVSNLSKYKSRKSKLEQIRTNIDTCFDSVISKVNSAVNQCADATSKGLRKNPRVNANHTYIAEGKEKSVPADQRMSSARSSIQAEINSLSAKIATEQNNVCYYDRKRKEAAEAAAAAAAAKEASSTVKSIPRRGGGIDSWVL